MKGNNTGTWFAKVEILEVGKLRNVAGNQKEAQKFINMAIEGALKQKCKSPEELEQRLKEKVLIVSLR